MSILELTLLYQERDRLKEELEQQCKVQTAPSPVFSQLVRIDSRIKLLETKFNVSNTSVENNHTPT